MAETQPKPKSVNIIIIGDGAVGKTSLLTRLDQRTFSKNHIRTNGLDSIRYDYTTKDGVKLQCKLWDTAGQERFKNMTY